MAGAKAKVKVNRGHAEGLFQGEVLELSEDGTYAVVCPEKKKKKGKNQSMAASAEVEDFADRFDREFGFVACESTSA